MDVSVVMESWDLSEQFIRNKIYKKAKQPKCRVLEAFEISIFLKCSIFYVPFFQYSMIFHEYTYTFLDSIT